MIEALNKANGKFAGVQALVFDLDGTLIDSKLDLALSIDATLKHMGRASLPHELIYSFVGNGAAVLVRWLLDPFLGDSSHTACPSGSTARCTGAVSRRRA